MLARTAPAAVVSISANSGCPLPAALSAAPATVNDVAASSCTGPSCSVPAILCRSSADASTARCSSTSRWRWALLTRFNIRHKMGITISSLLILVALLLPILWRLLNRVSRAQTQREVLLQRAVDASAEERQRIAGTLHDGPVQELAATSFTVAGAAENAAGSGQPELAEKLTTAAGAVRASIRGLRSLLVDIYPPSLTTAGLAPALTDLTEVLAARSIATHLSLDEDAAARLTPDQQQLVFRIARECLRNAARHASARNVDVRLFRQGPATVLEISDDGTGFDPAPVLGNPEDGHFGLRILTDMAADAGADLLLATAPAAGCRWRLEVPDP